MIPTLSNRPSGKLLNKLNQLPRSEELMGERILALARQLADKAWQGTPYGEELAEIIGARRLELHGAL